MVGFLPVLLGVCCFLRSSLSLGEYVEHLSGYPGQGYAVSLSLGEPPQKIQAIVDTGSSNFAVAGVANVNISHFFDQSQSTTVQCSSRRAKASYQYGSWQGVICQDILRLSGSLPHAYRVYVTLIDKSRNFYIKSATWQGILGLAYNTLALPDKSVVPVLDKMVSEHVVDNSFCMSLCGRVHTSRNLSYTGSLMLGSHHTLGHSLLMYTKIVERNFYSVLISDMKIDGTSLGMECQEYNNPRTFVDSGTTFLSLPKAVFYMAVSKIQQHVKKSLQSVKGSDCVLEGRFWTGTRRCLVTNEQSFFAAFPNITLSFTLADNIHQYFSILITPQLYLQAMPCQEDASETCFMFSIQESTGPCVLGTVVMEGYDIVFDRAHYRIGFGNSSCSVQSGHLAKPFVSGPFQQYAVKSCRYYEPTPAPKKPNALKSTVLFFSIVVIILLFVLCSWDNCMANSPTAMQTWHNLRSWRRRTDDTADERTDTEAHDEEPVLSPSSDDDTDDPERPLDRTFRSKSLDSL